MASGVFKTVQLEREYKYRADYQAKYKISLDIGWTIEVLET